MASEEIKVKLTFEDKATKKAEAATRKLSENTKRAVGETRKAIDVQKELNKQIKSFLMNTIGFMAMVRGVAELKKGLIDAGLQTEGVSKGFEKIRTTIADQLLPDVQLFFDTISSNADDFARGGAQFANTFILTFKFITGGFLLMTQALLKAKAFLRIGNVE